MVLKIAPRTTIRARTGCPEWTNWGSRVTKKTPSLGLSIADRKPVRYIRRAGARAVARRSLAREWRRGGGAGVAAGGEQRSYPQVSEIHSPRQLQRGEEQGRGCQQGRDAKAGGEDPAEEGGADAKGGEDHAPAPVGEAVAGDGGHVRPRRHGQQQSQAGKREQSTVEHGHAILLCQPTR